MDINYVYVALPCLISWFDVMRGGSSGVNLLQVVPFKVPLVYGLAN